MKNPIPAITRSLNSLSAILTKAEEHADTNNISNDVFLRARLFPDMFDLVRNVQISTDTAKGLAARLSQTENPSYADDETSFSELQERLAKTIAFMESVPDAAFEGAEDRDVTLKLGPAGDVTFTATDYVDGFATPNFYFHMATVYNILRHNGVDVGKRDFLGNIQTKS